MNTYRVAVTIEFDSGGIQPFQDIAPIEAESEIGARRIAIHRVQRMKARVVKILCVNRITPKPR